jgi:hypothetical protein
MPGAMKMNTDQMQTPLQGHFVGVNGMQLYYEVYGEGAPLVLLSQIRHILASQKRFDRK